MGYLNDKDMIEFFSQAREHLKPGGVLMLREDSFEEDKFWLNKNDHNLWRSRKHFEAIFKKVGLHLIHAERIESDSTMSYILRRN
jgi:spermidine synthase